MKRWRERTKKQRGGILAAAALLAGACLLGAVLLHGSTVPSAPLTALTDILPLTPDPAVPYTGTIRLLVAGYDRSGELAADTAPEQAAPAAEEDTAAPAETGEVAVLTETDEVAVPTETDEVAVLTETDGTAVPQTESDAQDESASTGRTDLIWYVQWDCDHGAAEVIQISPNLYVGPELGSPTGRINAIAGADAGLDGLCAAVTEMTGLPIDGYVSMDLDGLGDIVEYIGGVEVTLPQDLDDGCGSYLPAGTHLLGRESVEFLVRTRHMYENGEFGREQMLRRLFAGLLQYAQTCTLTDAAKLAPVAAKYLETNVELSALTSLAGSMESLSAGSVTFSTPSCYAGTVNGQAVILWDSEILSQLFNVRLGTWYTPEDLNLPEFDKTSPDVVFVEGSTEHLDELDSAS